MTTRSKYCGFCKTITDHDIDEEAVLLDSCNICGELTEQAFISPREYAQMKLKEMNKGFARVWIQNMLRNAFVSSDKDYYSRALNELDTL